MDTWVEFKSVSARCANCPGDTIKVAADAEGNILLIMESEASGQKQVVLLHKKVADGFFALCNDFLDQIDQAKCR